MESKNLIIRETEFDDCKYFAKWENLPEVTEFLSISKDQTYEDVVKNFVVCNSDDTKKQFTIVSKAENKPIGRIFVSRIDREHDSLDVTKVYIGDVENRNKGYGGEALSIFLEYAFINLHMERVTLDHYTGNDPAAHLYKKLGFQYEGVARNGCKKNGKYYDLHLMSMLRAEFFERRKV